MTELNEMTFNAETGEISVRTLNENEIEECKKIGQEIEAEQKTNAENVAKAKKALLEKLGITEEEAKLLLS